MKKQEVEAPSRTGKEGEGNEGTQHHAALKRGHSHATPASPEDQSADREDKTPPNVALPHHSYSFSFCIFKCIV